MGLGDIGKILPSELYRVDTSQELSLFYTNSLTHLYQPLIGIDAMSLYQTLYTESTLSMDYQTHHMLMNYIGLPLDRIYRARRKLEAIGLLQTFEEINEEQKVYQYLIHPPQSAQRFFENDFLSHLLYHQLGSDKYKKIKQAFVKQEKNKDAQKETTARFEDVFQLVDQQPEQNQLQSQEKEWEIPIGEKVDFEWLEQLLKQRMLPIEQILTAPARKLINQMFVAYDLTNQDIEKALLWSINDENQLLTTEFKNACMDLVSATKPKVPLQVTSDKQKVAAEKSEPTNKSKADQFIEMLEHISPRQLLQDLSGGNQPSQHDLKVISEVMTNQGLNPGVMNVLLHYVLLKTDMKLSKGYLETIASHWARKNVKTVRQAMTLAKSENKKYQQWTTTSKNNKRYSNKNTKKDIVPDWYKKQKTTKENKQPDSTEEKERKAKEADEMLAQYLAQQANDE
ncbi:replication initiation and membrane attachment family protein [Gracilibacillus kekensis]|uniref:Replicative DNA helicase loader DnaB n=1 Tax=Gracilibacillus kekensis TaxID=1027249 RepID=A0A1M7NS39_9BACI|nr:DnaD domain protein [Gracilibacillus kekensis]SHN06273.1 replicative DNA helicase loader DnaB [Gracilibacillus kekensis]